MGQRSDPSLTLRARTETLRLGPQLLLLGVLDQVDRERFGAYVAHDRRVILAERLVPALALGGGLGQHHHQADPVLAGEDASGIPAGDLELPGVLLHHGAVAFPDNAL